MVADEAAALGVLNPLLDAGYRLAFARHVSKPDGHPEFSQPLDALPDGFARAKGIWVQKRIPRAEVQALGSGLVARAIDEQARLWPLYRFWTDAAGMVGETSMR